jgi:Universal stress protein family
MHNPLRSEAEMFRLVVIIGVCAAVVIAVALIIDPLAGAIVLAFELGAGVGLALRGSRGTLPRTAEIASADDGIHRILVVANETVGGRALLEEIKRRSPDGTGEVMVVVPALTASALEHWSSDVDGALADARERLGASLATMRDAGINARGHVGDHHEPAAAIEDALREFPADELVISTHPPARSRWLESGVVERARREVPLPVTHVIVDLDAETAVVEPPE